MNRPPIETSIHKMRISHRPAPWAWLLLLFLFAAASVTPAGQSVPNGVGSRRQNPFDSSNNDLDPTLESRRLKALNAERQKEMVSDAEKLLKLARELNAEIDTGNRNIELRKVADIEKLARNVKQKMSISVVGGPAPNLLPPPNYR